VECTNYRTVQIPTDRNVPTFIQPKFGEFYKDLFDKSYIQEGENAVFLEYAWNLSPTWPVKCDPCNGPPPVNQDLVDAGCDWIQNDRQSQVFFTRLHVRYSRDYFPQDLQFQVTPNKSQFQGRYVMTHPPRNADYSCDAGQDYLQELENRRKKEVDELRALTGWKESATSYIYEYSNQIRSEKNETPIIVWPSAPKGWGLAFIVLVAMSAVGISVWLGLELQRAKLKP
ncbi:MAG: DUF2330 domain-containing protein, partial [Flavobacteriales bacterium]|nr:DUF2330 domain-containing protein [Flavobacteriales bacterium]